MTELTRLNFQLKNTNYLVVVDSMRAPDGYNLNFNVLLKDYDTNRTIFQSICGDWVSAKSVVDTFFIKLGTMLEVDPDTVERARDGFLKN